MTVVRTAGVHFARGEDNARAAREGRVASPGRKRPPPIIKARHELSVFAVKVAREEENVILGGAVVFHTVVGGQVRYKREEVATVELFEVFSVKVFTE